MRLDSGNPWLTKPHHSALVPLPTHSLWASIAGRIRLPNAPLLIFFTGGGACCAIYIKLFQLLAPHVRVLFYDRAGLDQSTMPPRAPNAPPKDYFAQDHAKDLAKLLSITQLEPPYVLMGHSYGGIPMRCFFSLMPDAVAGMVCVDVATELMLALNPRIPPYELEALAEHVDYEAVTHLQEDSGMSDAEWARALAGQANCAEGTSREDNHGSADRLAHEFQIERQALGERPLLVLRYHATKNYQVIYDEAVKGGHGTEEQRRKVREFLDRAALYHEQLERALLGMSSDAEYRYNGEWGHDVPIRQAGVVVEEVKRLLERVRKGS